MKNATSISLILAIVKFAGLQLLLIVLFSSAALSSSVKSNGQTVLDKVIRLDIDNKRTTVAFTLSGMVKDEDGSPLPGVNIVVKNTTIGTTTDADGKYSLTVAEGTETLIFSFIGFVSQEIAIQNRSVIDVTMTPDIKSLNEVVVIGYGSVERKDVTGSVASVGEELISDLPMNNISQALTGRVAGLDIVSTGASPGSVAQIRLRGRRSINASNEPLIVLDGVPFYGSLNDINPNDIKSIDVLKDASSTAIYGSQGANGVILITTKRGEIGKAKFTYEGYGGIVARYGNIPVYTGQEFAERAREAARTAGVYPDGVDDALDQTLFTSPIEYDNLVAGKSVNWQDRLLQNGYQQKHQMSVAGGSEAVRYNIAGNIFDEEGILPENKFSRYSLRTNLDFTLSPKFNVGTSVMLQYNIRSRNLHPDALIESVVLSPLGSPTDVSGMPLEEPNEDGYRRNPNSDLIWDAYRYKDKRWGAFTNVYAEYQIVPSLKYRFNLGSNLDVRTINEFAGSQSLIRRGDVNSASNQEWVTTRNTFEHIISFDKEFGDHKLQFTGVQGIYTSKEEASSMSALDIPYELSLYHNMGTAETINGIGSDLVEQNLVSYVGRINYGFKGKYLMTLTMRADGASNFAANNKWGYFPSAAVAWRISDEGFLKGSTAVSDLKLRIGYGVTGNRGINPYQSQGGLTRTAFSFENTPAFGQKPADLANKDLKWESTAVYNLGLDFGFLRGRIYGNIELYNTNTFDLLLYRKLPITTGFDQVLQNVGSTNNKGMELQLNTVNVDKSDLSWSSGFTFYVNRERIVELYQGEEDDIGNRWFIGQPVSVYYDYEKIGIWQLDEADVASVYDREPGEIKIADLNRDSTITDLDRRILGNQQPKFVLNLTNSFKYKDFDLSFDLYTRWGHTTMVGAFQRESFNRLNSAALNYWTPDNPTNDQPRPDSRFSGIPYGSTLTYRDGSYIKLRYFTIGYTLPESVLNTLKVSRLRIFVTGQNLWYWTKSDIMDFNLEPERTESIETHPATRTIIGGITASF